MLMFTLFAGFLDVAINQALALSPLTREELSAYEGKCLGLEMQGTGVTLYVHFSQGSVSLLQQPRGAVDTLISGAPFSLLRMMLERNHHFDRLSALQLLSSGEVKMVGDIHLAQAISDIFSHLNIDWEEKLARAIGDVPAHWLGNRHRAARAWGADSLNRAQLNCAEYLQEEARCLPPALEVQAFLDEVDTLRSDTARLEQRIARLLKP